MGKHFSTVLSALLSSEGLASLRICADSPGLRCSYTQTMNVTSLCICVLFDQKPPKQVFIYGQIVLWNNLLSSDVVINQSQPRNYEWNIRLLLHFHDDSLVFNNWHNICDKSTLDKCFQPRGTSRALLENASNRDYSEKISYRVINPFTTMQLPA